MTTAALNGRQRRRWSSLDIMRGATIAGMILVNIPGSLDQAYTQVRHAAWHGWTAADLVFPFFLWIVGVTTVLSSEGRRLDGQEVARRHRHALRRVVILFAAGLFLNGFSFGLLPGTEFSWGTLRVPGVLQRIAICYGATYVIMQLFGTRGVVAIIGLILAAWWGILTVFAAPGSTAGPLSIEGNLAGYVDGWLLPGHTWAEAPAPGFDPEGMLTTIPAVATALTGLVCARWLLEHLAEEKAWWRLLGAGAALIFAGSVADHWMPINKNLWTSSYVVFTTGAAMAVFAVAHRFLNEKTRARWFVPFEALGRNAFVAYFASELLWSLTWSVGWNDASGLWMPLHDHLFQAIPLSVGSEPFRSLAFSLIFLGIVLGMSTVLWKRRIIINV